MIDYENLRTTVVKGLNKYLNCIVVRSNQDAELPPYPFISYTIITPMSEYKGTYGVYDDGVLRKPVTTTWSITALSDDSMESVKLANKAREWLDCAGTTYLSDNGVIVQSVGSVTNRDNVISVGYEYKNGFDCVFSCFDEVKLLDEETIETVSMETDWAKRLEARIDGVEYNVIGGKEEQTEEESILYEQLARRLNGVE